MMMRAISACPMSIEAILDMAAKNAKKEMKIGRFSRRFADSKEKSDVELKRRRK